MTFGAVTFERKPMYFKIIHSFIYSPHPPPPIHVVAMFIALVRLHKW